MKASIFALGAAAATVSAGLYDNTSVPLTTSTLTKSNIYTITSCAPTITNCPARIGQVTTEIYLTTTVCPVSSAKTLPPPVTRPGTTSTVYQTQQYTVTSCPPTVTNCPIGSKTSSVISYTTVIPPKTFIPSGSRTGSRTGSKSTTPATLPPATSKASSGIVIPPPASTGKPTGPVIVTVSASTCAPSYITSYITVTGTPSKPAAPPASSAPAPPASKPTTAPSAPASSAPAPPASKPATAPSVPASSAPAPPASKPSAPPSGVASPSGFKPTTAAVTSPASATPSKAQFTGGASVQKAGGLMVAVGIAAALL